MSTVFYKNIWIRTSLIHDIRRGKITYICRCVYVCSLSVVGVRISTITDTVSSSSHVVARPRDRQNQSQYVALRHAIVSCSQQNTCGILISEADLRRTSSGACRIGSSGGGVRRKAPAANEFGFTNSASCIRGRQKVEVTQAIVTNFQYWLLLSSPYSH